MLKPCLMIFDPKITCTYCPRLLLWLLNTWMFFSFSCAVVLLVTVMNRKAVNLWLPGAVPVPVFDARLDILWSFSRLRHTKQIVSYDGISRSPMMPFVRKNELTKSAPISFTPFM